MSIVVLGERGQSILTLAPPRISYPVTVSLASRRARSRDSRELSEIYAEFVRLAATTAEALCSRNYLSLSGRRPRKVVPRFTMKCKMRTAWIVFSSAAIGCTASLNVGSYAPDATYDGGTERGSEAGTTGDGFEASTPETGTAQDAEFEASVADTVADGLIESVDGSIDSGSTDSGGGQEAGACASYSLTFNLTTNATGSVYYYYYSTPWPDSTRCGGWLEIAPADGAPLNLWSGGSNISCPASAPQPAAPQSFIWDGTYYLNTSDTGACPVPPALSCPLACAPPGNYLAILCVGYAGEDAGPPEIGPPTCKQVPFAWPPTSAVESIDVSITPTPDGGA